LRKLGVNESFRVESTSTGVVLLSEEAAEGHFRTELLNLSTTCQAPFRNVDRFFSFPAAVLCRTDIAENRALVVACEANRKSTGREFR
jgi:hypothetical protein